MSAVPIIDVQKFINSRPVSRFQQLVIALCFGVVAIDGFDTTAIGFIAPAIRAQWNLGPSQLAPLFGAGLFGLMLGAFLFGPIADRIGRRPTLIATTLFFGVATIASAFANSIETLIAARFLTGVGLGGAMPIAIALTGEFSPESRRSSLVTLMFSGFLAGSATSGLVASLMVVTYGWQGFLIVTGLLPLLLTVALWAKLPESVRFQALQDVEPDEIASTLKRISPETDLQSARFYAIPRPRGSSVKQLFSNGLMLGTLMLWVTFFMSLLIFYLLSSWLPILITSAGFSLKSASLMSTTLAVGGTLGAVAVGRLMDIFNPHWALASFYGLTAIFVVLLGCSTAMPWLLVLATFGAGFGGGGAQVGLNALATAQYETAYRATGVSWANAVGRFGSVLGSMVGGLLMSMGWELATVFAVASIPALVAAAALIVKSHFMSASRPFDDTGRHAGVDQSAPPLLGAVETN